MTGKAISHIVRQTEFHITLRADPVIILIKERLLHDRAVVYER
tara:strand:+ start:75 stop:203 length:129 start_codon:yes stop_codon:yes gene_type:complete